MMERFHYCLLETENYLRAETQGKFTYGLICRYIDRQTDTKQDEIIRTGLFLGTKARKGTQKWQTLHKKFISRYEKEIRLWFGLQEGIGKNPYKISQPDLLIEEIKLLWKEGLLGTMKSKELALFLERYLQVPYKSSYIRKLLE